MSCTEIWLVFLHQFYYKPKPPISLLTCAMRSFTSSSSFCNKLRSLRSFRFLASASRSLVISTSMFSLRRGSPSFFFTSSNCLVSDSTCSKSVASFCSDSSASILRISCSSLRSLVSLDTMATEASNCLSLAKLWEFSSSISLITAFSRSCSISPSVRNLASSFSWPCNLETVLVNLDFCSRKKLTSSDRCLLTFCKSNRPKSASSLCLDRISSNSLLCTSFLSSRLSFIWFSLAIMPLNSLLAYFCSSTSFWASDSLASAVSWYVLEESVSFSSSDTQTRYCI
mmetsp:Transcript_1276/g.2538  ORF Transcript_1276/g.2538 Transcript_1276/m.2538 type:complete len:284 (+) Transcript_1276:1444-2295(+)